MRRITKAALGGVAGCALVLGGTGVANGALLELLKVHGDSEDLISTGQGALPEAKAKITIDKGTDNTTGRDNTTFTIRVTGVHPSVEGDTLGSHLHTGPCVGEDGGAAGPHYNHDVVMGVIPATISTDTEVWFDLVTDEEGMAYDRTTVPFIPVDSDPTKVPGVMSIVVHVEPTNPDTGIAGARQACFPLDVSQVFPTQPPAPAG